MWSTSRGSSSYRLFPIGPHRVSGRTGRCQFRRSVLPFKGAKHLPYLDTSIPRQFTEYWTTCASLFSRTTSSAYSKSGNLFLRKSSILLSKKLEKTFCGTSAMPKFKRNDVRKRCCYPGSRELAKCPNSTWDRAVQLLEDWHMLLNHSASQRIVSARTYQQSQRSRECLRI